MKIVIVSDTHGSRKNIENPYLRILQSEIYYAAPGFCAVRQLPIFHAPIDTKIPQAERRSASDRKQEEKNKDMDDRDDFHDS